MTRRWLVVLQVVLGIALAAGLAQAGLSWLASARAARVPAGAMKASSSLSSTWLAIGSAKSPSSSSLA